MTSTDVEQSAPIQCPRQTVRADWIDYNGHMNMAYYHVAFDRALDHVFNLWGIGEAYAASGAGSCFTLEVHVRYLNELVLHDDLDIRFQLLDHDSKRLHFFEEMVHARSGTLVATSEQLAMHVSMTTRKSAPFPDTALQRIRRTHTAHAGLPRPDYLHKPMGIRR